MNVPHAANPLTIAAREAMSMGRESGDEAFRMMAMVGIGCMIGVSVMHGIRQGVKILFGHRKERPESRDIDRLIRLIEERFPKEREERAR
jgi:hypothetical protein